MDLDGVRPLEPGIPAEYLEHHGVLPVNAVAGRLTVATWHEAVEAQVIDDLRLLFGAEPDFVQLPEAEVRDAIRRCYGSDGVTAEQLIAGLAEEAPASQQADVALDDLRTQANEAPVVRLVNLLLLEALEARASDVHLESHATGLHVRYRIDGVLQDAPSPPAHLRAAIVSRLKIMAELDIAERRVPQDGRIRLRLQDRDVDVRVSVLPTLHGESVVLRLLDKQRGRIALDDLGMGADVMEPLAHAISRPHGIVLVTGPTGSGKTTTLYAAVDRIRTGREKILTVEDPVEYELPGVNQVPVSARVGLTFAAALRALLRQDPDVLLVGEIRDAETAEIATHAALTGHLVLSTLHTNDATGALTRLLDLGVADYLVTSTIEAVLAQRLVRRICTRCTEQVEAEPGWAQVLGLEAMEIQTLHRGQGCADCRGTGFRGRTGIYELLVLDDSLRELVMQRRGTAEIRRTAIARGMRTLRQDGIRQVISGVTTPEEVLRVTLD